MSIKNETISIQKDVIESIFNSLELKQRSNNNSYNPKVKEVSTFIRVKAINMNEIRKTKNLFSAKLKNMYSKKPIVLTL